jgi:hypothetical protein
MTLFNVTLRDADGSRGWLDPTTREPTDTSILQVEADSADNASEFALTQNPGLEVTNAEEVRENQ